MRVVVGARPDQSCKLVGGDASLVNGPAYVQVFQPWGGDLQPPFSRDADAQRAQRAGANGDAVIADELEAEPQIAVLYMKGRAEFWWRGTGCSAAQLPWHQFCQMLGERFNETSNCDAVGQFHSLKKTLSVTEYVEKFEELMSLVKRDNPMLSETYFVSSFISGLKDYIQHHLQCYKPVTLSQAFWYAKRLEQATPPQRKQPFLFPTQKPQKQWVKDTKEKDQIAPNIAELRAAGKGSHGFLVITKFVKGSRPLLLF